SPTGSLSSTTSTTTCVSTFSLSHPAPFSPYTLSLHDALPISHSHLASAWCPRKLEIDSSRFNGFHVHANPERKAETVKTVTQSRSEEQRLNSSHRTISYAVFCLKKKIKLYMS